jgi:hypothetical protein
MGAWEKMLSIQPGSSQFEKPQHGLKPVATFLAHTPKFALIFYQSVCPMNGSKGESQSSQYWIGNLYFLIAET